MKRFNLFAIGFIALISFACNVPETTPVVPTDTKEFNVSIGFSGIEISETPISRASEAKDWYAFQVYSKPENSNSSYSYYAYGFFDNKKDMIISLKAGYEYKFDVSMAVEGSKKVYKFSLANAGWAEINNSFVISSTEHVRFMYEGYLYMKPNDTYDRPAVDRFFGSTSGFIPSENSKVNIEMKRVAFGARFVPKDFTEGSLEISIEGSKILTMTAGIDTELTEIISFNNISNTSDDYFENIPVNIVWVKPDGVRTPIVNETIAYKRNVCTTIEFVVADQNSTSGIDIFANETMTEGETIIADQDGINTEVNPNK